MNAMFVRTFASRDGGPKHRAERRVNGGQVSVDTTSNQARQIWHLAGVEQRVNDFPVSRVPADKQQSIHLDGQRYKQLQDAV